MTVDRDRLWDKLDDIGESVDGVDKSLMHSMSGLTVAITKLTDRIEHIGERMVPIKLVAMMFIIVFMGLLGEEGVKAAIRALSTLAIASPTP